MRRCRTLLSVRGGTRRLAVALTVAGALPTTASCATRCYGVTIDYPSDTGGFATAAAAVEDFAGQQDIGRLPRSGWHQDGHDQAGVIFRSGPALVHVIQGSDGTWKVGDGRSC